MILAKALLLMLWPEEKEYLIKCLLLLILFTTETGICQGKDILKQKQDHKELMHQPLILLDLWEILEHVKIWHELAELHLLF